MNSRLACLVRGTFVAATAALTARAATGQTANLISTDQVIGEPGQGIDAVEFNGLLYFATGGDLKSSDGTPAGTVVVKAGIQPISLVVMDVGGSPRLLFSAVDGGGRELWISDGTTVGTVRVKDIRPGVNPSTPSKLAVIDMGGGVERLFFTADDGTNGQEAWISDGTDAGTFLLQDTLPGGDGAGRFFVGLNGIAYYIADVPTNFDVLMRSDGTSAGTFRVGAVRNIYWLMSMPALNAVFFDGSPIVGGDVELWKSDGTDPGTVVVKDINPGPSNASVPQFLTPLGNLVLFTADDGVHGREVWRSDGTDPGTQMVQEVIPGNNPPTNVPHDLRAVNGLLYFRANDGVHGMEPWTSDGFSASLLKDINPGAASSLGFPDSDPALHKPGLVQGICQFLSAPYRNQCDLVTHVTDFGRDLFFADDGVHGAEIWATDGTTAGTQLFLDLYPGVTRSHVSESFFQVAGQSVFFSAHGPNLPPTVFTRSLWAFPLAPSLSMGNASALEGNGGTSTLNLTATLLPASPSPVTVDFATADGTATVAGGDYVAASGTLSFAPGETSQNVPVTINGDVTPEANETFFVNLFNSSGPPIANAQGTGTILNEDGPSISINDITTIESGITQFFVTLSSAPAATVSVNFATANGTATAGSDYTATSGTLTFGTGVTFRSINVTITSDTADEPDETFFMNLSNPTFGVIGDGQGQATIIDDDSAANLSVNNVTVTEPATTGTMSFTVTLSPASGQVVSVGYATSDGTTNPATAGLDYNAASGTVSFAPGAVTASVPVTILGDTIDELNETLNLNLSNPVNAGINDGLGVGTITDNDTTNITINNVTAAEGNPPGNTPFAFTVTLSAAFHLPLTVDYATAVGTTNPATVGVDYNATSGTLTFAPGTTTQTVTVDVIRDNLDEPTAGETFFVNLSNNSGGNLTDGQGLGTITDDDTSQIQITSVSALEGDVGTSSFVFDMSLSGPSVNQVTVNFATANGSGAGVFPATAGVDYIATNGTLTFPAGTTTTTPVSVTVNGDTLSENDETFFVNLSAPTGGATLPSPARGIGLIQNDDTPGFSINDVSVTEGNTGSVNATFTVTLFGAFSGTPSVDFATADGTAVAGVDYTTAMGTLTFTTGVSTRTLQVPVLGETLDEPSETFVVNLTNPTGGVAINDAQGTGTINDNDTSGIALNNVTLTEGNSGTTDMVFNVTMTVANALGVNVDYATADVTAVAPGDYQGVSGTLTFPACTVLPCPGAATLQTVTVPIVGELLDESNETFQLNLTNAVNANINDGQGIGNITDNDTAALAVADASALEGDTGTSPISFTVSLGGGKTNDVTVNYITCDPGPPVNPPGCVVGTATQGLDFVPTSGTLSFPACSAEPCPPQSLSQVVSVDMIGDTSIEPNETFNLYLTTPVGATITDNRGQGTILNDDGTPSLSIDDVDSVEPATGTVVAPFTVLLLPPSAGAITVNFATANGSATAPGDYTAASGLLSFAAGETSKPVNVTVRSDATSEPPESYSVNLSNPTGGAVIGDGSGAGTIVDRHFSLDELVHGSRVVTDLLPPAATLSDEDRYRLRQAPRSSFEVVVDALSGDALPIELDLLASDNNTVLASGTPVAGGGSTSLRLQNSTATAVTNQRVRVRTGSGGCGINCDAQDVYRIQARDTTYRVSRYNNSSSQITILLIQNPTESAVSGTAWFWGAATGTLQGSTAFSIPAKGVFSLNTAGVAGVAGTGGSITIGSDAPYGALIGKAVALESATGFTFDTPMEPRIR